MRVIGGSWRGRKLQVPRGDDVRPTTDRVKEALFNILGPAVIEARVLDLCCGSGSLGIEALSRGASRVEFVDVSRRALESVRANLERCGADPGTFELVREDAPGFLARWTRPEDGPLVILADPPYRSGIAGVIMHWTERVGPRCGLVFGAVEYGTDSSGLPGPTGAWDLRKYGESRLAVFRPESSEPATEEE